MLLPSAGRRRRGWWCSPPSRSCCICTFSSGPVLMWRWASMKPGITLMPLASIASTPSGGSEAPCPMNAILPPRTTTTPGLITVPLPTMSRALAITKSCADRSAAPRQRIAMANFLFILVSLRESISSAILDFCGGGGIEYTGQESG